MNARRAVMLILVGLSNFLVACSASPATTPAEIIETDPTATVMDLSQITTTLQAQVAATATVMDLSQITMTLQAQVAATVTKTITQPTQIAPTPQPAPPIVAIKELSQIATTRIETAQVNTLGEIVTMRYPTGWFALTDTNTIVITSSNGIDAATDSFTSDNVLFGLQVLALDAAWFAVNGRGGATRLLEALRLSAGAGAGAPTFGSTVVFDVNGDEAGYMVGTATAGDAVYMVRLTDTALFFVIAGTAAGESTALIPTFQAMLASVQVE